ncbi:MAG: hypothetical protein GXP36_09990 [Actinobacteria bacterium]|nr:hypothetical protein [Actinomycetota bacterium]
MAHGGVLALGSVDDNSDVRRGLDLAAVGSGFLVTPTRYVTAMDTNNVTPIPATNPGTGNTLDRAEALLCAAFSFEVVARCSGICPMCDAGSIAHAA